MDVKITTNQGQIASALMCGLIDSLSFRSNRQITFNHVFVQLTQASGSNTAVSIHVEPARRFPCKRQFLFYQQYRHAQLVFDFDNTFAYFIFHLILCFKQRCRNASGTIPPDDHIADFDDNIGLYTFGWFVQNQ
jgi:hypothetical protein